LWHFFYFICFKILSCLNLLIYVRVNFFVYKYYWLFNAEVEVDAEAERVINSQNPLPMAMLVEGLIRGGITTVTSQVETANGVGKIQL
jgi:hypothetical protein